MAALEPVVRVRVNGPGPHHVVAPAGFVEIRHARTPFEAVPAAIEWGADGLTVNIGYGYLKDSMAWDDEGRITVGWVPAPAEGEYVITVVPY